jgi:hypothetical protein
MYGRNLCDLGHDTARRRGVKPITTRYPTGKAEPINCAIPEMGVSLSLEQIFCRGGRSKTPSPPTRTPDPYLTSQAGSREDCISLLKEWTTWQMTKHWYQ